MSLQQNMVTGAMGGIVGALAMSSIRLVGKQVGLVPESLPHKVARKVALGAGMTGLGAHQVDAFARGQHLALGASYGAGYGLLHGALDLPPMLDGPLYGLAVYTINLTGLGPALNLEQGPWVKKSSFTGRQILIHLVFGFVTAVIYTVISNEDSGKQ
ncbi:MAG: hypothetical protein R3C14_48685 [Caldilineaceae bacterium]